jgi:hypothetical protein
MTAARLRDCCAQESRSARKATGCAAQKGADASVDRLLHCCANPIGAAVVSAAVPAACGRCHEVPRDGLVQVWFNGRPGGGYWCWSCAGTYEA